MTKTDVIGFIGVAILLIAYFLNPHCSPFSEAVKKSGVSVKIKHQK